ncbi:PucR family transcriptional regulator [Streptomyces cacaoi]|uniref:PucR family transcriptional regulator n=1 Tax=Streptomyces cacaoi TaxID=1898 RepID=UPI002609D6A0|nr:helix-turn-helix domain-containing protein [Streptomyces cacaoi]
MAGDLQQLVDALGARLGRSVAIDDRRLRLLAHSAHHGEADAARVASLMNRAVPAELAEHAAAAGAARATDLFTVPVRPELGVTVVRHGMPIRHDDTLLGYLWLTADEGPAGPEEAEALRQAARRAALVLHRAHLREEVARSRERELVRDLVSADPVLRAEAARTLIEEDLAAAGSVVAVVATLGGTPGEPLPEEQRLALRLAVEHARLRAAPARTLALVRPDHALVFGIRPDAGDEVAARGAEEMASALVARLRSELPDVPDELCRAGVGRVHPGLAGAATGYREARQAAEVARATGSGRAVTSYARLGVYALLAKLSPADLAESMHPGLRDLLHPESGAPELAETLRVYLDEAGDARRAAARLHIHRSTLYNRLHRVEELTGLCLAHGDDRLTAHLTLKIAPLGRAR